MLHLNTLTSKLQQSYPDWTHVLVSHLQYVAERVSAHSSELAIHSGRKTVTPKDVAQASLPLCVTCENYDADTNQCYTLQSKTNHQTGGSLPNYDGFCLDLPGQCGIVQNSTCVFSGGGSSSRRKRRAFTNTKKKAGLYSYPGFCVDHPTQCGWVSDAQSNNTMGSTCTSGGNRRRPNQNQNQHRIKTRRRTSRRRTKQQAGIFQYNGFCGDHPTQCGWSDSASVGREMGSNCSGGSRSRKHARPLRQKKRSYKIKGGSDAISFEETRLLNMKATKDEMQNRYNIRWSNSALQLLQQTLQFHMNEIAEILRTEDMNQLSFGHVLDFLSSYKV